MRQNGEALRWVDKNIANYRDFAMEAVSNKGLAIQFVPEALRDRELIQKAMKRSPRVFAFAPSDLKDDAEIAIKAAKSDLSFADVSHRLKNDRDFVMEAVSINGNNLAYAGKHLRDDPDVVKAAIQQNVRAICFASERLYQMKEIRQFAVQINADVLYEIKDHDFMRAQLANPDILSRAVKNSQITCNAYLLPKITNSKDALEFLSTCYETSADHAIFLDQLGDNLLQDPDFIQKAVEKCPSVLNSVFENSFKSSLGASAAFVLGIFAQLRKDKDLFLKIVQTSPQALQYAADEIRNDRAVVMKAVKKDSRALAYASEGLRGDKEVVMEAARAKDRAIYALMHASESLRNDREVVIAVVQRDGSALEFASDDLRKDREVAIEAVKQTGMALRYVL